MAPQESAPTTAGPIFLSHAAEDVKLAARVCKALEASGLQCWIAPRDIRPAEPWASAIVRAIAGCAATVLIVSQHSLASRQVVREVELSDESRKPVLAVRIDGSKLAGDLEYFLLNTQWFDASAGSWDGLVEAVRALVTPDALESVSPAERGPQSRGGAWLRALAAEAQRTARVWLGVLTQGAGFIRTLELQDLRTVLFGLRFLAYMQAASALIALSLVTTARAHPVSYTLGYVISGFVETLGAVLIYHGCFRAFGGAAPLPYSATVWLLYAAYNPLVTLCLSPVRSEMEPVFKLDYLNSTPEQILQAFSVKWTLIGALAVLGCGFAATLVQVWSFGGIFRSLRMVHGAGLWRAAMAVVAGTVVYLFYVLLVGTPFERALYLY